MEKRCYGCMHLKSDEPRCSCCGHLESEQNAAHQLPVGTILHNQYLIGKVLGQGGFGITYLGWDRELEARVAIKEYYPGSQVSRAYGTTAVATNTGDPTAFHQGKERFLKEARTLARLRHLYNIVLVHGVFSENNTVYIVMEYVEGITLLEHIRRRGGRLSPEETFTILRPIIHAMSQVHQEGLIHRDISPDNIMLQSSGMVKLLDFGTARDLDKAAGQLTHSTQAVLKRGFAPVEQYSSGRALDQRADEYALCATIYYCLTGKLTPDAFDRFMDQTPIPWAQIPGLTPEQIAALETGTAIRAEDRFPDLKALEEALFPAPVPEVQLMPPNVPLIHKAEPISATVPHPGNLPQPPAKILGQAAEKSAEVRKPKFNRLLPGVLALAIAAALGIGTLVSRDDHPEAQSAAVEETQLQKDQQNESALEAQYSHAKVLLGSGAYQEAYESFTALGNYQDSQELATEARYQQGALCLSAEQGRDAYQIFTELDSYKDSPKLREIAFSQMLQRQSVAAGGYHTVAIKEDGTVFATGEKNYGQCQVSGWTDIVAVAAGDKHTVGLKADGTVVATGWSEHGRCDVSEWTSIVAVAAGNSHTVGLKADGTVVATGWNRDDQCDVTQWTDIIAIAAGESHTVGLKADSTVVSVGQGGSQDALSAWRDIVAIAAGMDYTVGLKADGTVVAAGRADRGQCHVSEWKDIVAVSCYHTHTLGLKADGTVVVTGDNLHGQCAVTGWKGIAAVCAGTYHSVGLKADGTVVAVGSNSYGQRNISSWRKIHTAK